MPLVFENAFGLFLNSQKVLATSSQVFTRNMTPHEPRCSRCDRHLGLEDVQPLSRAVTLDEVGDPSYADVLNLATRQIAMRRSSPSGASSF